ncbi:hypothetical protein [Microbispora bryophytorum]|uniref:hypothetical protein n=1 Tax=Microbispora bryophytorum TaxID=1460882 RepID=UPI0033DF9E2E
MTTVNYFPEFDDAADKPVGDSSFPALKHKPAHAIPPAAPKVLAPVRAALLKNPDVNLPDEAAGVITAGLVDPIRFRMLTETHLDPNNKKTSLLTRKRVSEGTVFVTPQHDRYIDMGCIPDLAGARWLYTLHNELDVEGNELPVAKLGTAVGQDGYWAMLDLEVADHQELAARILEAFVKTGPDSPAVKNDYTDSILQSGVKEPLVLVPIRIRFRDGSDHEHYLVIIDGNSRYVSMWKARTGGNVYKAAAACIEAVVGTAAGTSWRRATQRQIREALATRAEIINQGLLEERLTENTIRLGHTMTAPTVVVVGGRTIEDDEPLSDLVAAREDLIATIHTDATPWDDAAQAEQGMSRLLRRAVRDGLITADQRRVIEGRCSVQEMHALLGLPPHRLWAAALTVQAVVTNWTDGMRSLFREEFNSKNPTRQTIGRQIASTALSGYRSKPTINVAMNAFSDGGPIGAPVWGDRWTLTGGSSALEVLDVILKDALGGDSNAVAQLCVLGGTAGMLGGLITRDRGSKLNLDGKRTMRQVPFRSRPYRIVEMLAKTQGGLRTLHSLAVSHVTGKPAKQFWSYDDPDGRFTDGDPVVDSNGTQVSVDMEWDIVVAADPAKAADEIAAASATNSDTPSTTPEPQRLRETLRSSVKTALHSVDSLILLAQSHGVDVFGSFDSITEIKTALQDARDKLNTHGPSEPIIVDDDEDDDEQPGDDG